MTSLHSRTSSSSQQLRPTLLPKISETVIEHYSKHAYPSRYARRHNNRHLRHFKNQTSGCRIPRCILKDCNLMTHHHPPWTWKRCSPAASDQTSPGCISLDRALDMLPKIPDSPVPEGFIRQLFHQFISYDVPRLAVYFEPPSMSSKPKQVIYTWQQANIALGLTNPLMMLTQVCSAHVQHLARCEQLEPANLSTGLYGCLLRHLRQALEETSPGDVSDSIRAIPILVLFDMSSGYSQAIESHRRALRKLVSQHNLSGESRTLMRHTVAQIDLLIAAFLGKSPIYVRIPDRTLYRSTRHALSYGLAFESDESREALNIDSELADVCEDVCRAIEIVEKENWTFQPGRLEQAYNDSDIQYLYFMRNNTDDHISYLLTKDLQNPTQSRPVLFAMATVGYLILHVNYLPLWSSLMANQLLDILESQDLQVTWNGHEDMLCWLLCIMAVMPKNWKRRNQAMHMFGKWLISKSIIGVMDCMSSSDAVKEICDLEDFVWSSQLLTDSLNAALKEIDDVMRAAPNAQTENLLAEDLWLVLQEQYRQYDRIVEPPVEQSVPGPIVDVQGHWCEV